MGMAILDRCRLRRNTVIKSANPMDLILSISVSPHLLLWYRLFLPLLFFQNLRLVMDAGDGRLCKNALRLLHQFCGSALQAAPVLMGAVLLGGTNSAPHMAGCSSGAISSASRRALYPFSVCPVCSWQ